MNKKEIKELSIDEQIKENNKKIETLQEEIKHYNETIRLGHKLLESLIEMKGILRTEKNYQ